MSAPLGVVLAGGAGSRLGGAKPTASLGGRPLLAWVADALAGVADEVVVVAKPSTPLPAGVPVWREPAQPVHPLAGIAWALSRAGGRAVLVCPVDLPFVGPATLRALRDEAGEVVVAAHQPLLGRFGAGTLTRLQEAVGTGAAARTAVTALSPVVVPVAQDELFNVNTPGDLAAAQARLAAIRR